MCGIVGIIDTHSNNISEEILRTMAETMIHRGPDGDGIFIDGPIGMAMRRLSIIDLEGGWQPFYSNNKQVVAFQNGEIYNYLELRSELSPKYTFMSDSDTEVLAHGYVEWGIDGLLERLDGMYAVAILDLTHRVLHLARDRYGEKPLFYSVNQGKFAYSSHMLTLTALPWVENQINDLSLSRYLGLHYIPGEQTIFTGVERLLPGERLMVSIDNPVPVKSMYYNIEAARTSISDRELLSTIEEAVSSRLVADVPLGIFLSGGLDSSIVAALAAKHKEKISTFSMGFDSKEHDESEFASILAKQIGSTHYHFRFNEDTFLDLLPKVASVLDEPIGDQAMLPLYWLCGEARKHVTVALSGEGADEIFGGYGYYRQFLEKKSFKTLLRQLAGKVSSSREQLSKLIDNPVPVTPSGFPLLTDVAGREYLLTNNSIVGTRDSWEYNLLQSLSQVPNSLQAATIADMTTWLPDNLLVKFDRMAMAHSLEGRAPFLSPKVVKAGLSLPENQRMNPSASKIALRRVAEEILPSEILKRPKQGFVLPMRKWLVEWFNSFGSVKSYFSNREFPGLNMDHLSSIVEEDFNQGINRERFVFAVIMLLEWYAHFNLRNKELSAKYRNIGMEE
ncbi:Asparagine synthetase [glutamine-hydrolyzing] 1 [compost metagenome]